MKKQIVIPAVLIMVLALAGTAMARPAFNGGFGNGGPGQPCMQPFWQPFEQLTPEKQKEVKAVFQKYEDKFESNRNQMWAKRTELRALVASGKAEKKDITTLVKEMSDLKTKQYNLRKQLSGEIEQISGIAMPAFGGGGYGMDNGRSGFGGRGMGRHNQNFPGPGCPNYNF
ncbi:Spy/CpxP family protein refolding chaperone [Maridesulfovibrio sp.]|uniref:Spy/CpxP family protein refolding chaperone n=1 Tax=Maridesulfovibrio sp. TaxID=2795000 RepID=UPI002A18B59D|nr:Spy/CpxP family protein refolding chaperone [Maridesulfovibrio sp.]